MSKLEISSYDKNGAPECAKSGKNWISVALFFGLALIALNTSYGDSIIKGWRATIFEFPAAIKSGVGVMFIVLFEMAGCVFKYIADNFYSICISLGFILAYWKIDDFMDEMRDDMKILKKKAAKKCSCWSRAAY